MEQNTESKAANTGAQAAPAKKGGRKAKAGTQKRTSGRKPRTSGKSAAKRVPRKPEGKGSRETVKAQAIALLKRAGGASLPELMKKFEWLPHTTRGFISILGKEYKVVSEKVDGTRTYRIK